MIAKLIFCVLGVASAQSVANAESKRSLRQPNHDICYQIVDTWWPIRQELTDLIPINELDAQCEFFSGVGNAEACNTRNTAARRELVASLDLDVDSGVDWEDIACTMTGTGNGQYSGKLCVSNYCNHLNDGHCNLWQTGGQCAWLTVEQLRYINSNPLNKENFEPMPEGKGCYRNTCNMPGMGQGSEECPGQSNGILECTWCRGSGDPVLSGLGMGCQATVLNFPVVQDQTNICAPINNGVVQDNTRFVLQDTDLLPATTNAEDGQFTWNERQLNRKKCQCSSDYRLCSHFLEKAGIATADGGEGSYECRDGNSITITDGGQQVCNTIN